MSLRGGGRPARDPLFEPVADVQPVAAPSSSAGDRSDTVLERLEDELRQFGLTRYESRVLLAVLQLGSATATRISALSGVTRTSVYPALESLTSKRLVEPLQKKQWGSPGREEVFRRLYSLEERRLRHLEERMEAGIHLVGQLPEEDSQSSFPYVRAIEGAPKVKATFETLLRGLESELLMFVRPPFAWSNGQVNPTVIDTLSRGVVARVLYAESHLMGPSAANFRREQSAYLSAGVQARVVDRLPIKVTIFDRRVVILVLNDPVFPEVGYPVTQLIEHPGYAEALADSFEYRWAEGKPCSIDAPPAG